MGKQHFVGKYLGPAGVWQSYGAHREAKMLSGGKRQVGSSWVGNLEFSVCSPQFAGRAETTGDSALAFGVSSF